MGKDVFWELPIAYILYVSYLEPSVVIRYLDRSVRVLDRRTCIIRLMEVSWGMWYASI